MRIRSIHPEFWRSEDVAAMDWDARLVFIGLWSYVDDNGVGRDVEKLILAELFPLEDDPRETLATLSRGLQTLSAGGQITRYTVDGRPFLHVTAWKKWQKIDRPGKERYPLPTREDAEIRETVATPSRDSRETPSTGEGEKGRRGEVKEGPRKRGHRLPDEWIPSPETRQLIASERPDLDLKAEHQDFCDYWHAEAGQNASKLNWDLAWRRWMRGQGKRNGHAKSQPVRTYEATPAPSEDQLDWDEIGEAS